MKKILSAILVLVLSLGVMTGCMPQGPITNDTSLRGAIAMGNAQIFGDGTASILPKYETDEDPNAQIKFEALPESVTSDDGSLTVYKDDFYNGKETVALYIYKYGRLPLNYVRKSAARDAGWEGGNIEEFVGEGYAIGGDEFGNYEGLLPGGEAVQYYECDIDTVGKDERGAKRLVFDYEGNVYYTEDHYESFECLYSAESEE